MSFSVRINGINACCLAVVGLFLSVLLSMPAQAEDKIVASGDGIEVSKGFVQSLGAFYEQKGMTTDYKELRKGAVRMRIFAAEAQKEGLVDEVPQGEAEQDIAKLLSIQNKYIQEELKKQEVEDRVVESYYHANPRRFVKKESESNSTAGPDSGVDMPLTDEDLQPLDEDLADKLKAFIRRSKRKEIADNLFQELEKKYNIQYTKQ